MIYRLLPPSEWDVLSARFATYGGRLPDPRTSQIAVAEEDGVIVGFLVLQFVPHLEPLWIDEAHRGKVYWPKLQRLLEDHLDAGDYFVFAPTDRMAELADAAGLEALPWTLYKGTVPCRS